MQDRTLNQEVKGAAVRGIGRKRALLYLRVSTPRQVNNDYDPEGISIPAQREAGQRKAAELGADIVDEYVEPGRSATDIDNRPVFQEMLARVRAERDVDYIVVQMFSRMFRNTIDAAIVKNELRKLGVRVVSTMLDLGEGPIAEMVEMIMHAVDEYQVKLSNADVKYKMGQKGQKRRHHRTGPTRLPQCPHQP